jgi:hypothetical protein
VPQIALSVAVVEEEDEERRMATDVSKAEECLPADGTGFTKSQQYRYWDEDHLDELSFLHIYLRTPLVKNLDGDRSAGYSQGREFILTDPVICVKM